MSTQSSQSQTSQSRPRAFTSPFRGSYSDQHLRVSDAERRAVADRLAEHFAEGRLDQAELDERVDRAMSAKTRADLNGLFDDLPETNSRPETGAPAVPERSRRRRRHPVLVLVFLVVITVAVAHAVVAATVPWLWLGLVAAILFLATRGTGRSRASQHR